MRLYREPQGKRRSVDGMLATTEKMKGSIVETLEFFLFNTTNTLAADVGRPELDRTLDLARRYELLFSRTNPESALHRLNAACGNAVEIDPELAAFIVEAKRYCADVDGLFDITMGTATRLWDFHTGTVPDPAALKAAIDHVNWKNVVVQRNTARLADPQAVIDLGGIAKGYIADKLVERLMEGGARHCMVNLGGNVAVCGGKPDKSPWRVGIRHPAPSSQGVSSFAVVEMESGSLVTSGVYERAFERDGALYHHILDPKTGSPAHTDIVSATVVSRTSLDGDGYTTALVIMGADRALRFAEEREGIELIVVTNEGDVLATSGIGETYPFKLIG